MLKDSELERHYSDLFAMYGSPGWRRLQLDFEAMLRTHDSLVGLSSAEQLWFRKGQIDMIAQIISHQDMHERAYNDLVEAETGTPAEAPTGGIAKVIE